MPARTAPRSGRLAGLLLSVAGSTILMGIITGEALYPRLYRTSVNTISDLGGTRPPEGLVLQPSAAVFDTTMIVTGCLILIASVLLRRAGVRRLLAVPTALLGVGVLGVGLFPGNTGPHPVFALLAFSAGGVAALVCTRVTAGPFRYLTGVLGIVALTSLIAGLFLSDWAPVSGLGEGGVERWIAYPVVLWMVAYGGYRLGSGSRG